MNSQFEREFQSRLRRLAGAVPVRWGPVNDRLAPPVNREMRTRYRLGLAGAFSVTALIGGILLFRPGSSLPNVVGNGSQTPSLRSSLSAAPSEVPSSPGGFID